MGRCLGEQTAGGAVGREINEMDFLPFASFGSPGGARRERAGEEGRAAARIAAGSFHCSPRALTPRAGRSLWLILFPSMPHPSHTLLFKPPFFFLAQARPACLCHALSCDLSMSFVVPCCRASMDSSHFLPPDMVCTTKYHLVVGGALISSIACTESSSS